EWYSKSANNGCAEGQYGLGNCYYYGRGIAQDYNEAFEWYSGRCGMRNYYYGRGVARDYNKAFEWYSKSANNGCAEGQYGLGSCYDLGRGIAQDHNKASEWYSKADRNVSFS